LAFPIVACATTFDLIRGAFVLRPIGNDLYAAANDSPGAMYAVDLKDFTIRQIPNPQDPQ
jgi:hypothetical protein